MSILCKITHQDVSECVSSSVLVLDFIVNFEHMLRHLRTILRSLSRAFSQTKKQCSLYTKSITELLGKNTPIMSTYSNTSETSSGDCSLFLTYHVICSKFLLAGERTSLNKAFETTIPGSVHAARIKNRWSSGNRSRTCLFGMNTMYDHWRSSKSPPTSRRTHRPLNEVVISSRLNAAVRM